MIRLASEVPPHSPPAGTSPQRPVARVVHAASPAGTPLGRIRAARAWPFTSALRAATPRPHQGAA